MDEALAVARQIGSKGDRARALAELVPRLADLGRAKEALAVAREIGLRGDRAGALAFLGHVREALAAAWGIKDVADRAGVLTILAPHLAALSQAGVLPLWGKALRLSATRSRHELLSDLAALAPVIAALGGPEAIEETCLAIEEVGRWWP